MANYYCSSRSNYFRVKDVAAFKAWAATLGIDVHARQDAPDYFAVFPASDDDTGAFPILKPGTDEEIAFAAELSGHLADESVAIILEAGAEKLRYIHGHAIAVNALGEQVQLFLDDIYELAAKRFARREITRAEY